MSKSAGRTTATQRQDDFSLLSIVEYLFKEYNKAPLQWKVLDLFSVCSLATALVQFLYAFTMGTFPFNAFLAGFFCCIGSFVLTASLRMQLSNDEGGKKSVESLYVDYVLAMTVLFLAVWCYIG